jgi:hypothetical protein
MLRPFIENLPLKLEKSDGIALQVLSPRIQICVLGYSQMMEDVDAVMNITLVYIAWLRTTKPALEE